MTKSRITVVAGSLVIAGSIVLAVAIRPHRLNCSYLPGAPPPCPMESVTDLRIGIVAAGFAIALLILVGGRVWSSRRRQ